MFSQGHMVRRMHNNKPGNVRPISNVSNVPVSTATPEATPAPHRSRRMTTAMQTVPKLPTCIPQLRFIPISGGLQSCNVISQDAINFLTKCVWANLQDIFTANLTSSKLMWNSILSTEGTKYLCLDIKKLYLIAPLNRFEYMKMPIDLFLTWIVQQYFLK
jgi:hypothetical protein